MIIKPQSEIKDTINGLYLVSTPIGNLKDITYRAVDTLRKSDYILCEDTRVSQNLLKKYDIKSKLISNHKFNEKKNLTKIIELLKSGTIISLISDAGTPSISDPGSILIQECVKNDITVTPIPGASAVAAAISIKPKAIFKVSIHEPEFGIFSIALGNKDRATKGAAKTSP